jgi:hypothetical protein
MSRRRQGSPALRQRVRAQTASPASTRQRAETSVVLTSSPRAAGPRPRMAAAKRVVPASRRRAVATRWHPSSRSPYSDTATEKVGGRICASFPAPTQRMRYVGSEAWGSSWGCRLSTHPAERTNRLWPLELVALACAVCGYKRRRAPEMWRSSIPSALSSPRPRGGSTHCRCDRVVLPEGFSGVRTSASTAQSGAVLLRRSPCPDSGERKTSRWPYGSLQANSPIRGTPPQHHCYPRSERLIVEGAN